MASTGHPGRPGRAALSLVLLAWLGAAPLRADVVERRGVDPALLGRLATVDDAGVEVDTEFNARVFVPWDRVRAVTTERTFPDLADRLERAERLWRARSRVERGDTSLAEPLFTALFPAVQGATHETALVVAEGLLRCRIARGDTEGAIIPALETMRLRRAGLETASYAMLRPVLDPATGLCLAAPPAWTDASALGGLEAELAAYRAGGDARTGRVARLYRLAVRGALGLDDTDAKLVASGPDDEDDSGLVLLRIMADATGDGDDRRATALAAAERRLGKDPGPAEAWLRFAAGSVLLRADDEQGRRRGLVHLLHLPARFLRSNPYLAGLALRRAADAYADQGDTTTAAALRAELAQRLPAHPARTAEPLNEDDA